MALTITSETYRSELLQAQPTRMLVMCYDETLVALEEAILAIEKDDIEARCNAVAVAAELLATLFLCLDMKNGGVIAENLSRIYAFILEGLPRINLHNDPAAAEGAIALLMPLREAWFELDCRNEREGPIDGLGDGPGHGLAAALDTLAVESAHAQRPSR